jgi:hypothetical protein
MPCCHILLYNITSKYTKLFLAGLWNGGLEVLNFVGMTIGT